MKKLGINKTKIFEVTPDNFLFSGITYFASPNQDDRPIGIKPEIIVIHGISLPPGDFVNDNIKDFFLNRLNHKEHSYFESIKDLKVSSHLLIDRNGILSQFVPLNKRAWHAGSSCYQGTSNCNDFSIGIELEGQDHIDYTELQYRCLVKVAQSLMYFYPIIDARKIVAHSDIAPTRKTDPGPSFDWFKLYEYMDNEQSADISLVK